MPPLQGSQLNSSISAELSVTTSTMTPSTGLLACSNEVLTMIFHDPNLNKKDIKSLRLTCKEFHSAVTREFAMRYLTEPVVSLSRSGLQSLVDICRHPICGPHVRAITFLVAALNTKGLKNRVHDMRVSASVEELAGVIEYASLCKEEQQLKASEDRQKLLANALEAISRPISIAITNDLESVDPAGVIGLPAIAYHYEVSSGRRTIKSSDVDLKMRSWFTSVEETIDAMTTKDRLILAGLSIRLRRRSGDAASAHSPDCIEIQPLEIYSNLTTLRLDLNLEALKCPVSSKSWKDLLKLASKLQELRFSTSYRGTRAVGVSTLQRLIEFFDSDTAFKLNALVLVDVPCTSGCLLRFLERHKQTLATLKLCRTTLVGRWKPCLSWMRKNLDLKYFHIYHPQWTHPSTTGGVSQPRGPFVVISESFTDEQSVNAGLDRLILDSRIA